MSPLTTLLLVTTASLAGDNGDPDLSQEILRSPPPPDAAELVVGGGASSSHETRVDAIDRVIASVDRTAYAALEIGPASRSYLRKALDTFTAEDLITAISERAIEGGIERTRNLGAALGDNGEIKRLLRCATNRALAHEEIAKKAAADLRRREEEEARAAAYTLTDAELTELRRSFPNASAGPYFDVPLDADRVAVILAEKRANQERLAAAAARFAGARPRFE